MKTNSCQWFTVLTLLALATINSSLATLFAQGTAFTYQGRLNVGTNAATGIYDLRFALFDTLSGGTGTQQGNLLTNSATAVTNGLFTVTLDFSNQFPGAPRWLEIGVRSNGVATFSTLTPRQPLTPVPYAICVANVSASQLPEGLGGSGNTASGQHAVVAGGFDNAATAAYGTIGGGFQNSATASWSTVGGGANNAASGFEATVAGGYDNIASGNNSFAAGRRAMANHQGTFVWADSTDADFTSTSSNQFLIRASGGVGIGTASPGAALDANITSAGGIGSLIAQFGSPIGSRIQFFDDSPVFNNGPRIVFNDTNAAIISGNGNIALIPTGNVGIGTTTPTESLTIAGVNNYNNGLKLTGSSTSGTGMAIENTASGGHKYDLISGGASSTEGAGAFELYDETVFNGFRLTITTNGNVGLGTPTPNSALAVYGNIFMGKQRNNTTFNQVGDTIYLGAEQKYLGNTLGTPVNGTTDWVNLMANSASAGIIFGLSTSTANPHSNNIPLMVIKSNGNVGIGATNPAHLFVVGSSVSPAYSDGATWVNGSDRNSKEDFAAINPAEVLQKVAAMPMTKWQYKVAPGQEHIGPMAQDFHTAFGLNGSDDKHISTVDEGGVALAAIQGLNQKVEEKDAKIRELEARLEKLEQLVNVKNGEGK